MYFLCCWLLRVTFVKEGAEYECMHACKVEVSAFSHVKDLFKAAMNPLFWVRTELRVSPLSILAAFLTYNLRIIHFNFIHFVVFVDQAYKAEREREKARGKKRDYNRNDKKKSLVI